MPELEVRNLTKRYGKTVAVDDLSSTVEAGRVTGFLGPGSGSGKRCSPGSTSGSRPWRKFACFFVLSTIPELLPGDIGDYFPAQALGSMHGLPDATEEGLAQVAGGLVFSGWVVGLALAGTVLIRRDVTE